jgi:hypothetical protein
MKIGDFRFQTTNRGLAACLATLGVPLKQKIPVVNCYSERKPVPKVPFGHPRWYAGSIRWFFEAASETCFRAGKPIMPNELTKAYYSAEAAAKLDAGIAAIDAVLAAGNHNEVLRLWALHKDSLPLVMAGFIRRAMDNRERLFLPLLKEAYEEEKKTGRGPDIVTVSDGEGEIHTTKNPSETVKETLL